jgi:vacuolar-type H+-ATPase subunit H
MTQDNGAAAGGRTPDGWPVARTTLSPSPSGTDSLGETQRDIEQTRGEMSGTLEAIQAKLDPDLLKEQAKEIVHDATEQAQALAHETIHDAAEQAKEVIQTASKQARETIHEATDQAKEAVHDATVGRAEEAVGDIRQTVRGMGTTMLDTIKQNPVPAALAGIGLGWLYMKRREAASRSSSAPSQGSRPAMYADASSAERRSYEPDGTGQTGANGVSDAMGRTAEQAKAMAGGAVDHVQTTAGQAKDTAGDITYQALESAGRAVVGVQDSTGKITSGISSQVQQMLDDSPLALGGLALATGAAIGLLLPTTQSENQLMGQARDRVLQQAKETAKDVQPKVEHVIGDAKNAGMQEAQNQAAG